MRRSSMCLMPNVCMSAQELDRMTEAIDAL